MTSNVRLSELEAYLKQMGAGSPGGVARVIADNPQAHLDALVAAGVLVADPVPWTNAVAYYLPVHVHEWRVMKEAIPARSWNDRDPGTLRLGCGCGASATAPNKLPIEVPE